MKYYVQNGSIKRTGEYETMDDAALSMAQFILDNHESVSLITVVSERGFINDLLEMKMLKEIDEGNTYLTSSLFGVLSNKIDSDAQLDKYVECVEAETFMMKREAEIIGGVTEGARLIENILDKH